MDPITTDSLSILTLLAAKPADYLLKPDVIRRILDVSQKEVAQFAQPLIQRRWINRHLLAQRSMTLGYSLTPEGRTTAAQLAASLNTAH